MLADVREALTLAARDSGLRAYGEIPSSPNPDCVVVGFPDEFDPHAAFGDIVDFTIPVYLFVKFASTRAADEAMERYLSTATGSLLASIEAISGAYNCRRVHDIQPVVIGDPGIKVLQAILDVRVMS